MIYVGIIFITVIGTFLHFLYELSGHNKFVAIFAAVNESTWEHIKICMTPTIIWSLYEIYKYGLNGSFLVAKSLCFLTIILLIPILFYTYTYFTKKSILVVDIICFIITVTVSQLVFNYLINKTFSLGLVCFSILLLIIELALYFIFTYYPLNNFIFEDPISHKYGLSGHTEMKHHKH